MNEGVHLKIVKYSGLGKMCRSVFLKFSHDLMHTQANHYDAIVNVKEAASNNTNLLSSIVSQQSKATATVSATGEEVLQDQPLDLSSKRDTVMHVTQERNEVIDLTDTQIDHEITPLQIKNDTDFQVIADDIQVIQDDAVESQDVCQQIGRGKYFPVHLFDNIQPQEVNKIPECLEGLQLFQIKTNINTWHRDTSDLHHFNMHFSCRQGFSGIRKVGTCFGSYVCPNKEYALLSTSQNKEANKVNFKNIRGSKQKLVKYVST